MRSGTSAPGSTAGITLTFEKLAVRILTRYGSFFPVADHVVAHHAERVLVADVDLALGNLERLGKPRGPKRPRREPVEALLDDVAALLHPLDEHPQPVVGVAALADRHLELDFGVLLVGLVLPRIHRHTRCLEHRARTPVRDRRLSRDRPDVAAPGEDDLVAHDQLLVLVHDAAHRGEHLVCARDETARQVVLQAADACVGVMHARAGHRLDEVLHHLAFAERVEQRRDRAELQRIGAHEHEVVHDPVPLGEHRADPLRPVGHLDLAQTLDRDRPSELVVERRQPVVTVHQHERLARVAELGKLLRAAVHVTDDRLGTLDDLAVELDHNAEHPVRGRVLRTDVEDHVLGLELARGDDVDTAATDHRGDLVALERGPGWAVDHRGRILPKAGRTGTRAVARTSEHTCGYS